MTAAKTLTLWHGTDHDALPIHAGLYRILSARALARITS